MLNTDFWLMKKSLCLHFIVAKSGKKFDLEITLNKHIFAYFSYNNMLKYA